LAPPLPSPPPLPTLQLARSSVNSIVRNRITRAVRLIFQSPSLPRWILSYSSFCFLFFPLFSPSPSSNPSAAAPRPGTCRDPYARTRIFVITDERVRETRASALTWNTSRFCLAYFAEFRKRYLRIHVAISVARMRQSIVLLVIVTRYALSRDCLQIIAAVTYLEYLGDIREFLWCAT